MTRLRNDGFLGSQFGLVGHVNDAAPLGDVEGARAVQDESYRGMRFHAGFRHAQIHRRDPGDPHALRIRERVSRRRGRRRRGDRGSMFRPRESYADVHLEHRQKGKRITGRVGPNEISKGSIDPSPLSTYYNLFELSCCGTLSADYSLISVESSRFACHILSHRTLRPSYGPLYSVSSIPLVLISCRLERINKIV